MKRAKISPWLRGALSLAITTLLPTLALAAPHIHGGREHPATGVGPPLSQRLGILEEAQTASWQTPTTLRLLFLRVDFPPDDDPRTTGSGEWIDCIELCNGDPDYWINKNAGDLVNYYDEVSGGRLSLEIDISATVYRLPEQMIQYGCQLDEENTCHPSGGTQIKNFFSHSLQAAQADIDFSTYDTILVVHAGAGEETDIAWDSPGDLWSLYYNNLQIELDGLTISEGIIMPQTGTQDRDEQGELIVIDPLGVYAHEFGHWLGLPDLYSTAWFQNWKGIGNWGLMGDGLYNRRGENEPRGSGPAHPEAWSKLELGWAQTEEVPAEPDPQTVFNLAPIQHSEQVLQLSAGAATSRYFLLENRQQSGFDQGLPGSGLLVWLIDPDVIEAQRPYNSVNNSATLPGVKLIEADGDNALLSAYGTGDLGSTGDPFPGSSNNTAFTPHTTPSSSSFGQPGWLYLQDVNEAETGIEFTLGFAPPTPRGLTLEADTCNDLNLRWEAVSTLDLEHYRVYRNEVLWQQTSELSIVDTAATASDSYRVSAVDIHGFESPRSASVGEVTPLNCESSNHCLLAALAINSSYATDLRHIRHFRDQKMKKSSWGRYLIKVYYRSSPAMAELLLHHPSARAILRPALRPLLSLIKWLQGGT